MSKSGFLTGFISFLIFQIKSDASPSLEQRPLNQVVRIHEQIVLSCRWENVSGSVTWYFWEEGGRNPEKINDGNEIVHEYFVGSSLNGGLPGQKLTIPSASYNHGGTYTCTAETTEGDTMMDSVAIVVILDHVCEMTTNQTLMEGMKIEIRCIVTYKGPLTPKVKWKQRTIKDSWKDLNVYQQDTSFQVTSILIGIADSSVHESRFSMEIDFNTSNIQSSKKANNTPTYKHTWTSPMIRVLHGPYNVSVTPSDETVFPSNQLTCYADGYPPLEFQWINMDTNDVSYGPNLLIDDKMAGDGQYLFSCVAINIATNRTENVSKAFTVKRLLAEIKSSEDKCQGEGLCKEKNMVVLLSGALAVTLTISFVVILALGSRVCRRVNKNKQKDESSTKLPENQCNKDSLRVARISQNKQLPPTPVENRLQHHDSVEYLSPQVQASFSSPEYDVIPDLNGSVAVSVQNTVYLDMVEDVPSSSAFPIPAALRASRATTGNDYLDMAGLDPMLKTSGYETLQRKAEGR